MFIPTTKEEMKSRHWQQLDVILVTGDTYIDSPFIGVTIIGKVLIEAGYRVGIIAQPDIHDSNDICRLGTPRLFWGVTAGSVDSMVANYTALKKRRKKDDYTPGGINNRRPDRASIVYANLIKKYSKGKKPIVLGGIEASLRRIAHYDYWDNRIRRSILFDAKADLLVYGMAERTIVEIANHYNDKKGFESVRGVCYISKKPRKGYLLLPSFSDVCADPGKFIDMFHLFYRNNDPIQSHGLCQQQDTRYLIQNPPPIPLSQNELDAIFDLEYERSVHPFYQSSGEVRAIRTIKFAVTSHRGCFGECHFCAIHMHQGREIQNRSVKSILKEVRHLTQEDDFKGYIMDIGGPTANMYELGCGLPLKKRSCRNRQCLFPATCPHLCVDHEKQIQLLRKIRQVKGVKKAFVASGLRYDLIMADQKNGRNYLRELTRHHISGQLKIAPEHVEKKVLLLMGKGSQYDVAQFKHCFYTINQAEHKKQFLTYYFMAAHPGCSEKDMKFLQRYIKKNLHLKPEQVQIFTPTPSTYSSLMYYTGIDPFSGQSVFVEKNNKRKEKQKKLIINS